MSLIDLFYESNTKDFVSGKLEHYFQIYENIFEKYKNNEITFLEIGINKGGDLLMWENYFTNLKKLIAIDILPECKKFENDLNKTEIIIGDQGNIQFLEQLSNNYKNLDIVLDDGGHQFHQQINSFEYLFKSLNNGGIYIIEDTHSSYDNYANIYPKDNVYGGGRNKLNTTIEYFKKLVDEIHAWSFIKEHGVCPEKESRTKSWSEFLLINNIEKQDIDYFRENIDSITFYDSIIVIRKNVKQMPCILFSDKTGEKYYNNRKKTVEYEKLKM
jgi:hypothetical protein|tara:strand:+ start:65 stop:880 length:816 start_codon:yes stop_codon:yes gene_type:complete